jgi:Tfp pilus assembly PilM family ATPase
MMEYKKNRNGNGLGIAIYKNSVITVQLDTTSGKPKLINATEEKYPENDNRDVRQWRGLTIGDRIANAENNGINLKYCVPANHLMTKKVSVDKTLTDDIPDWLEWSVRQSLPKSDEKFVFDFYKLGDSSINSTEYLASIYPESITEFIKSLRKSQDTNIKPVSEIVALLECMKIKNPSSIPRYDFILNFNDENIAYAVTGENGFIAEGCIEIGNKLENDDEIDNFITDVQTAINFHLDEKCSIDDYNIVLCGDIDIDSPVMSKLTERIKAKVSFTRPLEYLELDKNIENPDNIKRDQHRYTTAIGTALMASSFTSSKVGEMPQTG